jgi:hypothetical protein
MFFSCSKRGLLSSLCSTNVYDYIISSYDQLRVYDALLNPFYFTLFPRLTFKRVIRKGSVEEFSCIPYILTLFSNLTYTWYGLPVVSSGWENWTVFGISSLGALFESTFIIIYTWFAPRGKKVSYL